MRKVTGNSKAGRKTAIVIFWLIVWQITAMSVNNKILLAGPAETLHALASLAAKTDFWRTVFYSAGRICAGFLSAFLLGLLLGGMAYFYPFLREILKPAIGAVKAVPVAVFAVILLIWFGSTGLTVWVSFLIVFPQVYTNTIAGLDSTDRKLLEMAQVMGTPWWKKSFFIYRPALMPYLTGCSKTALGMSWKSGVAAEVIGTPAFSIGERLYMSKIYLDTAGIFAWTFVIILMSLLFEKGFLFLLKRYEQRQEPFFAAGAMQRRKDMRRERKYGTELTAQPTDVICSGVCYDYGAAPVLLDVTLRLRAGRRYCLMGQSGRGKTTLLRLLAGLTWPRQGNIGGVNYDSCSMVFQEDRLCEQADAVQNVCMAKGVGRREALYHLEQVLDRKDCLRPVSGLSGGMRRRVALCRAVAAHRPILLLDEPFNGLDEGNREGAVRYLLRQQRGRTLLAATHREEDAALLDAEVIHLP